MEMSYHIMSCHAYASPYHALFSHTYHISWLGTSIVLESHADTWLLQGLCGFLAQMYMEKVFGYVISYSCAWCMWDVMYCHMGWFFMSCHVICHSLSHISYHIPYM